MKHLLGGLLFGLALAACNTPGDKPLSPPSPASTPSKDWYAEELKNLPDSSIPAVFLGHPLKSVQLDAYNENWYTDTVVTLLQKAKPGEVIGPLVEGESSTYYKLLQRTETEGFMARCIYVAKDYHEDPEQVAGNIRHLLETGASFDQVCQDNGSYCFTRYMRYTDFSFYNQDSLRQYQKGNVAMVDEPDYYYVLVMGEVHLQVPATSHILVWNHRKEKPLRKFLEAEDLPAAENGSVIE